MKRTRALAIIAVLCVARTALYASDSMKTIVASYLDVQARLAGDKIEGIKPAAQVIEKEAARMGAGGDAILKAAKAIEQAADLKAAREAFGTLSDAVIAAGDAEGWKDVPDVRVAYCPMVKKSWVQKDEAIKNPYYGSVMLACGDFRKK